MSLTRVVVGIDGSDQSHKALRWAAAEAALRNIELQVVHAYEWRVAGALTPVGGAYADHARERAERVVDAAVFEARGYAPGLDVRGEALLGLAVPGLLRASGADSLVVLGHRGGGGFASLLLGSVSQQVATHANGPIVVVRGRMTVHDGPIVVGVDGSTGADLAIGVAFEEAAARATRLVAVRAFTLAPPPWGPDAPPFAENYDERHADELRLLNEEIDPWREKYPSVAVETRAVVGHAAEVLGDMSSTAQAVVVGTRGHGGFTGLLLGSVGLQLLHHADSPVLIARGNAATAH
jgi:nucleotide-binding universal stress UspA family protein